MNATICPSVNQIDGLNRFGLGLDSLCAYFGLDKVLRSLPTVRDNIERGATLEGVIRPEPANSAKPWRINASHKSQIDKSAFEVAFQEIKNLSTLKNEEQYKFKPTFFAINRALDLMVDTYFCTTDGFLGPSIMPDGESGIIIEWEQEGDGDRRVVSLILPGDSSQRSYLYRRSKDGSSVEYALSGEMIAKHLKWLIA